MANRKYKLRRDMRTGAAVRRRARKWLAVTAMAPVLALPAALVSASALPTGTGQHSPDLRQLGVSGNLPQAPVLSSRLLAEVADPAQLSAVPQAAPRVELPTGELGIPEPVLAAYMQAARSVEQTHACGMHWSVLASIGRIESGHARNGDIDINGTTVHAILGPRLSGGPDIAAIPDTDAGRFDGDPVWDRAVGPMQFIPSTWRKFATDGNEDGVESPHSLPDAAAAAGTYLCDGGGDLNDPRALAAAVFRYNHSESYVRTVMIWAGAYRRGVTPTPSELAPATGDVLAGERMTDRPDALAMPGPASLTIPEIAPVPPVADPQPQALQPVAPAPETPGAQSVPGPAQSVPGPAQSVPDPAQSAPDPAQSSSVPAQPSSPSASPDQQPLVAPVEPAPPRLPSAEPTTKPAPETPPVTPAPQASQPAPPSSFEPAPPSSSVTAPPSSDESAPPSSSEPAPPSSSVTQRPTSSEPLPQVPSLPEIEPVVPPSSSASSSEVPKSCDTTLLDRGEFALVKPETGGELKPGQSLPAQAPAGVEVFTNDDGAVKPCTVPDNYKPQ